jgi:hypothetical protein
MKKQTAVEWLAWKFAVTDIEEFKDYFNETIEQAKEMEKEQMKEVAWHFRDIDMSKKNKGLVIDLEFEQYYNETFKSE